MHTRPGYAALLPLLSLLVQVGSASAAGDTIQGTLTVNGKTRLLKYVYVTRATDPEKPRAAYLIILASDAEVPAGSRLPPALTDLAKRGQIHAVRVIWKEGTDSLTATPLHGEVEGSGTPTVGGAMIDLRAYNEKRLTAQINSKPLGQIWHFNATLEAAVAPVALTKEDVAEPVPIVPETTDVGFLQAVNEASPEAVRLFLKLGMSASTVAEGMPLLMSAVLHCTTDPVESRVAIIKALVAAKAKVDVADENGSTPLLWSVNPTCPADVAGALIAAGANVNVKAKGGATPMMMAKVYNRADIIKLLQAAGAKP